MRSAPDDGRRLLLRRVQDALRDLHVFERQMILIRSQLLDFAPNFSRRNSPRMTSRRRRASSDVASAA
jgi:hypothetical protein